MKILVICNTDGALLFREPILKGLIANGHSVTTVSSKSRYFDHLRSLGVIPRAVEFARHSISLFQNLGLLLKLCKISSEEKPDIVHSFTHKPAIYGTIAARLSGAKSIYVTVTGLGTLFMKTDFATRILRELLIAQYRFALRFVDKVFFQNPDDLDYFVSRGVVPAKKAVLTNGSGICLDDYPLPTSEVIALKREMLQQEIGFQIGDRLVVLFPARGVVEKGFYEFYEAANLVATICPERFLFVHLGLVDNESSSRITRDNIDSYAAECGVHYLGFKDNIQDYMIASDIVVLPSYREGTPRSLIEALALGKAIVASNAPGCKETVVDEWNGFLCDVKDKTSLVSKILKVDRKFISAARLRSRKFCEVKYDADFLVKTTLQFYLDDLVKKGVRSESKSETLEEQLSDERMKI